MHKIVGKSRNFCSVNFDICFGSRERGEAVVGRHSEYNVSIFCGAVVRFVHIGMCVFAFTVHKRYLFNG